MKCPSCQAENPDSANFCKLCGTKLKEVCDCWIKKEPYNCGVPLHAQALQGFTALTALSTVDDPAKCSLPFDKNRSGFVMGQSDDQIGQGEDQREGGDEHQKQRGPKQAHALAADAGVDRVVLAQQADRAEREQNHLVCLRV